MQAEVELISKTNEPIKLVNTAYKNCYSKYSANELCKQIFSPKQMLDLISKHSNHESPLEHVYFTFAINGISKAAVSQFNRHRHMSFSEKSFRYVEIKEDFDLIENIVANNLKGKAETIVKRYYVSSYIKDKEPILYWLDIMDYIDNLYRYLRKIKNGAKPEDARNILGMGVKTSTVVSTNLKELIHVANLRLCSRAQKEIREIVKEMCKLVIEQEPWLAEFLVPKCLKLGYCNEYKSCGFKPPKPDTEVICRNCYYIYNYSTDLKLKVEGSREGQQRDTYCPYCGAYNNRESDLKGFTEANEQM